jgi:SAM-dependent methyltransferase
MAETEPTSARLRELVEAGIAPPPLGPVGPLKGTIRRLLLRLTRARALHQRQVDLALLQANAELAQQVAHLRADLEAALQAVGSRSDELAGRLEAAVTQQQQSSSELRQVLDGLRRRVPGDGPLYAEEEGTFQLETFDAGLGGKVVGFRDRPGADQGQDIYASFEDHFRGSEEMVRERQRAYLPLLEGRSAVLDVGCGRGEFLELMREAGLDAEGIDIDPAMVDRCRKKGLDHVHVADAVEYLERKGDRSVGVIFAAQVIEHLSYAELLRLLRGARDTLAGGGLLIVETVNPHSPQGLKHFWIDPTHRHPLFPETIVALCGLVGYASAYIWYPQGTGDPARDRVEQLDYAVIAETGGSA